MIIDFVLCDILAHNIQYSKSRNYPPQFCFRIQPENIEQAIKFENKTGKTFTLYVCVYVCMVEINKKKI